MTAENWDAIIIGGSVAGLSAAQALGRSLRRTLVIDAGKPRNRFAEHMHNVLGHDGTPPDELLAAGRAEAVRYGVELLDGTVKGVEDRGSTIEVELETGERLRARTLVLATGITDELPDIPGLAAHWGTGVLHCPYCHGWEVRGSRIGVLATSPMSMHQVKLLRQWSDRVVAFTHALGPLDEETTARLRSRGIEIVSEPVEALLGDEAGVTAVRTATGREIPVDAIFTAATPKLHDQMLESLGLARNAGPMGEVLAVDPTGRTSHPRVWAAGNVVAPSSAVPQAMAAGAMAGAALNFALVEEDFDAAMSQTASNAVSQTAGNR